MVSNAIKYAAGKPIRLEVSRHKENARLVVQDFGPGIAPNLQPRIFERFSRAASSENGTGLGLGLYIVKEIVDGHQGSIQLESELGIGSTFVVDFPIHRHTPLTGCYSEIDVLTSEFKQNIP